MFRQLTKGEVKEIADIMLREVFVRADIKGIKIDVTERFKVCCFSGSAMQAVRATLRTRGLVLWLMLTSEEAMQFAQKTSTIVERPLVQSAHGPLWRCLALYIVFPFP